MSTHNCLAGELDLTPSSAIILMHNYADGFKHAYNDFLGFLKANIV